MSLLSTFRDGQFRKDVRGGLLDAVNRGVVAGLLGGPVDLATMALRPLGYSVEQPVGGSEWIGQKMQNAGMVSPNRNFLAEVLSAVAAPVGAVRGANAIAKYAQTGKMDASAASKSPDMLIPKPVAKRPFHDDYPQGARSDESGRLTHDIEGRPLLARYIAGRRTVDGDDQGIGAVDADRIADLLGFRTRSVARSGPELKGDAGRFVASGDQKSIYIDKALSPTDAALVQQHELGHGLESLTFGSKIPQAGAAREAAQVYSDLNSKMYVPKGKIGATPESHGYQKNEWESERMAESIRAYLRDPNYFKSVAPKLAARIREYLNNNPNTKKIVQFNSAGGVGLGLLGPDDAP